MNNTKLKKEFTTLLNNFTKDLQDYVSDENSQWVIKWFIDIFKDIYSVSTDSKIISKIIEIHLFPLFFKFAEEHWYKIVLAEKQNWYPDLSFVNKKNENIKFAVDLKTTYRRADKPWYCNWFTLGSHWEYFINRESTKNVQFPYWSYIWHFCLGLIYSRNENICEFTKYSISDLEEIPSVINNLQFFVSEKWKIASDRSWSWNTANIWSIDNIDDIINERWVFINLWEDIFDEYWSNHNKLEVKTKDWKMKKLTKLVELLEFKRMDKKLINNRK